MRGRGIRRGSGRGGPRRGSHQGLHLPRGRGQGGSRARGTPTATGPRGRGGLPERDAVWAATAGSSHPADGPDLRRAGYNDYQERTAFGHLEDWRQLPDDEALSYNRYKDPDRSVDHQAEVVETIEVYQEEINVDSSYDSRGERQRGGGFGSLDPAGSPTRGSPSGVRDPNYFDGATAGPRYGSRDAWPSTHRPEHRSGDPSSGSYHPTTEQRDGPLLTPGSLARQNYDRDRRREASSYGTSNPMLLAERASFPALDGRGDARISISIPERRTSSEIPHRDSGRQRDYRTVHHPDSDVSALDARTIDPNPTYWPSGQVTGRDQIHSSSRARSDGRSDQRYEDYQMMSRRSPSLGNFHETSDDRPRRPFPFNDRPPEKGPRNSESHRPSRQDRKNDRFPEKPHSSIKHHSPSPRSSRRDIDSKSRDQKRNVDHGKGDRYHSNKQQPDFRRDHRKSNRDISPRRRQEKSPGRAKSPVVTMEPMKKAPITIKLASNHDDNEANEPSKAPIRTSPDDRRAPKRSASPTLSHSAFQRLGPKVSKKDGNRSDGDLDAEDESCFKVTIGEEEEEKKIKDKNQKIPPNFIKLRCPQCDVDVVTFNDYNVHLTNPRHRRVMSELNHRLKLTLSHLRFKQRSHQKVIERSLMNDQGRILDEDGKQKPANFCKPCKLLFHQSREEHDDSEMHKVITDFLRPKCDACNVTFTAPLHYETHIVKLAHIRERNGSKDESRAMTMDEIKSDRVKVLMDQKVQLRKLTAGGKSNQDVSFDTNHVGSKYDDDADDDEIGPGEFNEEEFLTLDEIGEDDDENVGAAEEAEEEEEEEPPTEKSPPSVGQSHVRLVSMLYCDLCHKFLPRIDQGSKTREEVMEEHCSSPQHVQNFNRNQRKFSDHECEEEELDYEAE